MVNEATEISDKDCVLPRCDSRCRFYLKSKDRKCNAKVEEGTSYCGNHSRPDTAQEKARCDGIFERLAVDVQKDDMHLSTHTCSNLDPSIKAASRQKAKQDKAEARISCAVLAF